MLLVSPAQATPGMEQAASIEPVDTLRPQAGHASPWGCGDDEASSDTENDANRIAQETIGNNLEVDPPHTPACAYSSSAPPLPFFLPRCYVRAWECGSGSRAMRNAAWPACAGDARVEASPSRHAW